jgi:NAD(P)-dependent dehydrogenase (short-subunit alcohol dehydrogenase family)
MNVPTPTAPSTHFTTTSMAPLAGKTVLVIGGSSGIGFAVAKAALTEGASVVIASSSVPKLKAAASKLVGTTVHGDRLRWRVLDLKDEAGFKTLFDDIGKVDHLIHTVRQISGGDIASR